MFFKAGVLIDVHSVSEQELEVLGRSLELYTSISLGRLAAASGYIDLVIAKELAGEPARRQKIQDLIKKADQVLWQGRLPWSIYDHARCPDSAVLAHSLHKRLLRSETEIAKAGKHIDMLKRLRGSDED